MWCEISKKITKNQKEESDVKFSSEGIHDFEHIGDLILKC